MSAEDVAGVTKIPRGSVERLESDATEGLPAPVFVRGFIRSYAASVGLDPAPLVRAYDAQRAQAEADEDGRPRRGGAGDRARVPIAPHVRTGGGLPSGYMVLMIVALGFLIAAWLIVGGREDVTANEQSASPVVPLIQEPVDGVSAIRDARTDGARLR